METITINYKELAELMQIIYEAKKNHYHLYCAMGKTELMNELDNKIATLASYATDDNDIKIELDWINRKRKENV